MYAAAVNATPADQVEMLAMPLRENVRGNSTYVNTRRYLLGPDNPGFVMTPDGSGLGEGGRISAAALEVQARTTANAAEAARCRELARWLERPDGPSPRAVIRAKSEAAVARAAGLPHPRVFATAADFAALKERARKDALAKAGIDRAIAAADGWIGKPVATYGLSSLSPSRRPTTGRTMRSARWIARKSPRRWRGTRCVRTFRSRAGRASRTTGCR